MGIFTRFRDIVASNINSILDHAEDPEKMVRLMIQEMEETLVEVKSNCAGVMADQKKIERAIDQAQSTVEEWARRARLAVDKSRDDLGRAAINEKRRAQERADSLREELDELRETVRNYQADIEQLEQKLADARDKQRAIVQRRKAAETRYSTQKKIRDFDTSNAFARFEAYENGIDRLEAEADLVNGRRRPKKSLGEEFDDLEKDDDVERELEELKKQTRGE